MARTGIGRIPKWWPAVYGGALVRSRYCLWHRGACLGRRLVSTVSRRCTKFHLLHADAVPTCCLGSGGDSQDMLVCCGMPRVSVQAAKAVGVKVCRSFPWMAGEQCAPASRGGLPCLPLDARQVAYGRREQPHRTIRSHAHVCKACVDRGTRSLGTPARCAVSLGNLDFSICLRLAFRCRPR